MVRVRFYAGVYVLLIALATSKVIFFDFFGYWEAVTATMMAALAKTLLIVGYYQHLRFEPRSLSYLVSMGFFAVLLLTVAAAYSLS